MEIITGLSYLMTPAEGVARLRATFLLLSWVAFGLIAPLPYLLAVKGPAFWILSYSALGISFLSLILAIIKFMEM